jgi:hypothetical protein
MIFAPSAVLSLSNQTDAHDIVVIANLGPAHPAGNSGERCCPGAFKGNTPPHPRLIPPSGHAR